MSSAACKAVALSHAEQLSQEGKSMKYRAATEIIDRIADQVAQLAQYARALDESLCARELADVAQLSASELQHVDALAQYLGDLECLLRKMAPMLPADLTLPTEALRSAVHLNAMQRLITGTDRIPVSEPSAGDVTLF